jgi:hypothetical protein
MLATVVAMLFPAAAVFAACAIGLSWLRYGPLALALRDELAACEATRELRYVVVTTRVESETVEVWRPGFRPLAAARSIPRAPRHPSWRAAA